MKTIIIFIQLASILIFGCTVQKSELSNNKHQLMLSATVLLSKNGYKINHLELTSDAIMKFAPDTKDVENFCHYFKGMGFDCHYQKGIPAVFSITISAKKQLFENVFEISVIQKEDQYFINKAPNREIDKHCLESKATKIIAGISLNDKVELFNFKGE